MHRFANPARFQRLTRPLKPWLFAATLLICSFGLYLALVASPADYLQGQMVRVMYIHVPAAIFSEGLYLLMAMASAASIIWRHPLADVTARAAAPIGATFTAICLATGSLWGRPTWGTYWVWDARLTSVLVLLFLYLGYMLLWSSIDDQYRAGRAAAILSLLGAVNIPIIKFSVEWWHTLHQPASIRLLGPTTIHPAMLYPLAAMTLGLGCYTALVLLWRMDLLIARQRIDAMSRAIAAETPL